MAWSSGHAGPKQKAYAFRVVGRTTKARFLLWMISLYSLFLIIELARRAHKSAIRAENCRQRRVDTVREGAFFPCIFPSVREIGGDDFAADCIHRQFTQAP